MAHKRLSNQRGNVLLFTVILALPLMLVFAGLATDLGYLGEVDAELQRAMDAAALAGAGTLGFSCDPALLPAENQFHKVRLAARQYASLNPYRVGTPTLDLNEPNPANLCSTGQSASGDIVLGHWDPTARTFVATEDAFLVNAVQTRFSTTIPTSFLRLIGLGSLGAGATAIAWAPPPAVAPPPCCPVGLTPSLGAPPGNGLCGQPAFFISSSVNPNAGFNTAGWANLEGCGNPSAQTTQDAIRACATGVAPCNLKKGDYMGINNGMQQSTLNTLIEYFPGKFSSSGTIMITKTDPDNNGESVLVYEGNGWAMTVPVVDASTQTTGCPLAWAPFKGTMLASLWDKVFSCAVPSVGKAFAQVPLNLNMQIMGWTQFVVTQVVDRGECVVDNPADTINKPFWPPGTNGIPCGPSTNPQDPSLRGVYGYFNCVLLDTPGDPGAVAALGKPRLVR